MIQVTTESGSVYQIDFDKRTWSRDRGMHAAAFRQGRTDHGVFENITCQVGSSMVIVGPPRPDGQRRLVTSTHVEKIEPYRPEI